MKSDIDIKRDVEEELRLNPDLDSTDIAVAVKSGVVTLSGSPGATVSAGRPSARPRRSSALPASPTT